MDFDVLAGWIRFSERGGVGKCTAICDCVAESGDDLMFLKGDEITVLMKFLDREGTYLGHCEGVVGRFRGTHVRFHFPLIASPSQKDLSHSSNSAWSDSPPLSLNSKSSSSIPYSAHVTDFSKKQENETDPPNIVTKSWTINVQPVDPAPSPRADTPYTKRANDYQRELSWIADPAPSVRLMLESETGEEDHIMEDPWSHIRLRKSTETNEREISWIANPVPTVQMILDEFKDAERDQEPQKNKEDVESKDDYEADDEAPLFANSVSSDFSSPSAGVYDGTSPRIFIRNPEIHPTVTEEPIPPASTPPSPPLFATRVTSTQLDSQKPLMISMPPSSPNLDFSIYPDAKIFSFPGMRKLEERECQEISPTRATTLLGIVGDNRPSRVSRYQEAKLFPFPGMIKLEEERERKRTSLQEGSLTPAATFLGIINDNQPSRGSRYQEAKLFPFPGMIKLEEEHERKRTSLQEGSLTPAATFLGIINDNQPSRGSRYQDAKLFPFPGMIKLEEEREHKRASLQEASPTPAATLLSIVDSSRPSRSSKSFDNGGNASQQTTPLPGVRQWLNLNKMMNRLPFTRKPISDVKAQSIPYPVDILTSVPDPNAESSFTSLTNWFSTVLEDVEKYRTLLSYRGETAQRILDAIQMVLDDPRLTDTRLRQHLLFALLRMSKASVLYPKCYTIKSIQREDDPVAAGHFGEIWKGDFKGQKVCLKVVKIYQTSQVDHLLKAFCREAIVWRHQSHPNLLPFYGMYRLEDMKGRVCLVSPWMENGNIVDYLERQPDVNRLHLISDILHGVSYLHDENIVHGDLKGVNVLITSSGRACLADFGLSSVIDADIFKWTSVVSTTAKAGTLRWQAPEMIDPRDESSRPTKASDIYAFSCTCYEILTGRIPFQEIQHDATVIYRVCFLADKPAHPGEDPHYSNRGLTGGMWELMLECWHADASKRPTAQHALVRLPDGGLRVVGDQNLGPTLSAAQFRREIRIPHSMSDAEVEYIIALVG